MADLNVEVYEVIRAVDGQQMPFLPSEATDVISALEEISLDMLGGPLNIYDRTKIVESTEVFVPLPILLSIAVVEIAAVVEDFTNQVPVIADPEVSVLEILKTVEVVSIRPLPIAIEVIDTAALTEEGSSGTAVTRTPWVAESISITDVASILGLISLNINKSESVRVQEAKSVAVQAVAARLISTSETVRVLEGLTDIPYAGGLSINVVEQLRVAETITSSKSTGIPSIAVSESVRITETVSGWVAIPPIYNVSRLDTVRISESVVIRLATLIINVSDSALATEVCGMSVPAPLTRSFSVSDSKSVQDYGGASFPENLQIFTPTEPVVVQEEISILLPAAVTLSISVEDLLAAIEDVTGYSPEEPTFNISVFERISVLEEWTITLEDLGNYLIAVEEILAVVEESALVLGLPVDLTLDVTDVLSLFEDGLGIGLPGNNQFSAAEDILSYQEAVSLLISTAADRNISVEDILAVSEEINAASIAGMVEDILAVAEQVSLTVSTALTLYINVFEIISISDFITFLNPWAEIIRVSSFFERTIERTSTIELSLPLTSKLDIEEVI